VLRDKTNGWSNAKDHLAPLSTNSQHLVVDATHEGVVDDEVAFKPSVQAIADVVKAIRAAEPLVSL
jgi:hypothetical protein